MMDYELSTLLSVVQSRLGLFIVADATGSSVEDSKCDDDHSNHTSIRPYEMGLLRYIL